MSHNNTVYYEERLKILQKIHEIRDIVCKQPELPKVDGHMDTIYKCIRDGIMSEDMEYKDLCLSIILDHMLHVDGKCGLSDNKSLKFVCEDMASMLTNWSAYQVRQKLKRRNQNRPADDAALPGEDSAAHKQ